MKKSVAAIIASIGALCASGAHAKWLYSSDVDKMTGKTTRWAQIISTNSLSFAFPYDGPNKGYLSVRQKSPKDVDVVVVIGKGQILCSRVDGCPIKVRFDDAPPVTFVGAPPSDQSSDTVFIATPTRFLASAQKAKRILIQLNVYQNGAPILEFESAEPLTLTSQQKK